MRRGTTKIFFYVPNIIGYGRITLAVLALFYIENPTLFVPLYMSSCFLDAADGTAARLFGQCSGFGAVLDMAVDRSTTAALICYLCVLYTKPYRLLFQCLLALDLSSHFMHMYSTLISGSGSHKIIDGNRNFLLRLYYTSRVVLFFACAFNEAFFLSLYGLAQSEKSKSIYDATVFTHNGIVIRFWNVVFALMLPGFLFKQTMNVIQLLSASIRLAEIDAKSVENGKKIPSEKTIKAN